MSTRFTPSASAPTAHTKVLSHDELLAARQRAKSEGRRVVQCHGCFDIVHPGHIRHLRQARSLGDLLLVTITGDAQMKKGVGRPLIPEELRADNLAALDCVDWVYVEQRPTAAELLDEVRPDVYVKGREYETNNDPRFKAERHAVERHGGRVVFSAGDVVFSSTALIAALEHSVDPYHKRLAQLLDTDELAGDRLSRLVSSFRGKRVVVVGETIVDTYFLCDRPEVAGESPIMTLRPIERRTYDGGAAIIARHLAAMGASPVLVTALPRNAQGDELRRRLMVDGIEIPARDLPCDLPEKQRVLVGAQKVMKLDLVDPIALDAARQDQFVAMAAGAAKQCASPETGQCDAVILADFGQGLLSPGVLNGLCRDLRPLARIMSGDVSGRRSDLRSMVHMDLLCPSESELRDALSSHHDALPSAAWRLLCETDAKAALITMGSEGLVAFRPTAAPPSATADGFITRVSSEHVPALAAHAVDALGCGDALLSAATLTLASGGDLLAAAFLGSVAAATQTQRLGTTVVSATDLRHGVARIHASHMTYAAPESLQPRTDFSARTPLRSAV
jgi:rfaE bifunctional protein nucleotidyltransferase chain/domain